MKKKIVCLIDTLNSGGAQRQIVNLSYNLNKFYDVLLVYYYEINHFVPFLNSNKISYRLINWSSKLDRMLKIRKEINRFNPDVIIAFLDIPSLLAIISSLPFFRRKLILSERITYHTTLKILLRQLYLFADYITTNSHSNALLIERTMFVKKKIHTIYNSVDLNVFSPDPKNSFVDNKFIIVSSFKEDKNPLNLIRAVRIVKNEIDDFTITWFGHRSMNKHNDHTLFEKSVQLINEMGVEKNIILCDPVVDIENYYRKYSALILPSFYEGLPNVVCEAMACGLPILCGNVADAEYFVKENGFLFDPHNPESIAEAIINFIKLPVEQRKKMGKQSNILAKILFDEDNFVNSYKKLIDNR